MSIWRINTLSPQEITKYRQRSQRAINGLNMCKQEAQLIAQERKVADKYKLLAEYMGLAQEGGNSFYNFFVPLNENMVFLLRNANHNNANPMLYDRHEQLGRPNKRYIVFFKNGNVFSDTPVTFQESEHHVIPYGVNALDNVDSVVAYIDALIKLFTDGETTFPNLPIVSQSTEIDNNQQQLNCNTNMNKKLIRLTESDIHRIVKESVDRILNEVGDTEKGQRALGALTAAKFKGKKKGDWGEVAKKASDERDKASNKAAKSGYNKNEPWSSLKAWHKKRASMSDAYSDGYQKQVNESGFYPMEYDSKIGYYTPNGTVDGVDTYIDFDEMSFSELKALRDKYLEQVGHTPWNKIANARPDIFHAVNAIEEELEDRRERYREGDKSALS